MGFFENTLSTLGRGVDDALDRLSGGPNSGFRGRMADLHSWALDQSTRADDALARRGVRVSTLKIAGGAAIAFLCTTILWSGVRTVRAVTRTPVVQITPAEEAKSLSLSQQIVQQKRAAAAQPSTIRPGPARSRGHGQR